MNVLIQQSRPPNFKYKFKGYEEYTPQVYSAYDKNAKSQMVHEYLKNFTHKQTKLNIPDMSK